MNEKLKEFEINERFLTSRLLSHIPTVASVEYTKGRIAYDAIVKLTNQKTVLVEVKVRNCFESTYPDYILQVDKLVNLLKYKKQNGYDFIYYINYFKNPSSSGLRDCIIFNLGERAQRWKTDKPKVEKKWMNNETCVSTDYKVMKDVIMLTYDPTIDMKVTFTLN